MPTAAPTRTPGKTGFVKEYLNDHPQANARAVNEAWNEAGFEGTISPTLVTRMRSELGLTGNIPKGPGKKAEAEAGTTSSPAIKKRGRGKRATVRGGQQGKTAFVRDFIKKDPTANRKAVEEAWLAAGNEGPISGALVSNLRSEMGLTGKKRSRPAKGRVTGTIPEPTGVRRPRSGGRDAALAEIEGDIDRLIFKMMGVGGMETIEDELRKVRRRLILSQSLRSRLGRRGRWGYPRSAIATVSGPGCPTGNRLDSRPPQHPEELVHPDDADPFLSGSSQFVGLVTVALEDSLDQAIGLVDMLRSGYDSATHLTNLRVESFLPGPALDASREGERMTVDSSRYRPLRVYGGDLSCLSPSLVSRLVGSTPLDPGGPVPRKPLPIDLLGLVALEVLLEEAPQRLHSGAVVDEDRRLNIHAKAHAREVGRANDGRRLPAHPSEHGELGVELGGILRAEIAEVECAGMGIPQLDQPPNSVRGRGEVDPEQDSASALLPQEEDQGIFDELQPIIADQGHRQVEFLAGGEFASVLATQGSFRDQRLHLMDFLIRLRCDKTAHGRRFG
jgi:hypothetical protein